MDEQWDCDNITELTRKTMKNGVYRFYMNPWNRFLNFLELYFFNLQTKAKAWEVGQKHYDTGMWFHSGLQSCTFFQAIALNC